MFRVPRSDAVEANRNPRPTLQGLHHAQALADGKHNPRNRVRRHGLCRPASRRTQYWGLGNNILRWSTQGDTHDGRSGADGGTRHSCQIAAAGNAEIICPEPTPSETSFPAAISGSHHELWARWHGSASGCAGKPTLLMRGSAPSTEAR
jgi:hypothetical protein